MSKLAPALLILTLFTACSSLADGHAKDGHAQDAPGSDTKQAPHDDGWTDLFNGKDLTGWKNPYEWGEAKVVDGVIELTGNKKFFLTTEKQFSDFELEVQVMLPAEGKANSGVMFRCHVEKNKVFGYQAECDPTDRAWTGGLYDEGRRKWLFPKTEERGKTKLVQAPKGEWISYKIKCVGDHLQIFINGKQTVDYKDDVDAKGYLGLQHHGEKGQTYRFRNIRIKEIKADGGDA
jgi:hypothetical protein